MTPKLPLTEALHKYNLGISKYTCKRKKNCSNLWRMFGKYKNIKKEINNNIIFSIVNHTCIIIQPKLLPTKNKY